MDQLPDYSNFVKSAYVAAGVLLIIFGIWSLFKFISTGKKLQKLQKDEKKN